MPQRQRRTNQFLIFDNASIRHGEKTVFINTNWIWHHGEQWAVLGPDGSGKSLLVEAILGRAVIAAGELRGPSPRRVRFNGSPIVAHVSPRTQRDVAVHESSFYQLRWHSGLTHGPRTVREFLSQESVEDRNPFEIGKNAGNERRFLAFQRQLVRWFGTNHLWDRKLSHLSNGEMRKTLLVHELLKFPQLTLLEDVYVGLDSATRKRLSNVILRLMRKGWPVLFVTDRKDDIPAASTHVLLVHKQQMVAQGSKRELLGKRFEFVGKSKGGAIRRSSRRRSLTRTRSAQPLVELSNVSVTGANSMILRSVTWTVREGECWALLGPNGAGKTTLLNLLQGDHPQAYSQDIRLFGQNTHSTNVLWRARQQLGWMSPELHQHYPAQWSVEDVVCSGFFNSIGLHQPCSRARRTTARRWLNALGLDGLSHSSFGELSFGMQRLTLLARAVVKKPRLLILDEPSQGLDSAQRRTLLHAVDQVAARSGASLIFVTHDEEFPRCISHVLRLKNGRIQQSEVR